MSWPAAMIDGIPIGPAEMAIEKWCDEVDMFCAVANPPARIESSRAGPTQRHLFRPYVWHANGWEQRRMKLVTVIKTDDIDGTPADETIRFAFEGVTYEIDLSAENAARFREDIAPIIDAAQRAHQSDSARRRWEAVWADDLARRRARKR